MKVMISQPMRGFTEEQIKETRAAAIAYIEEQGHEFVDSYFEDEWDKPENMTARGVVNIPVAFLSKSIERMSNCDAVLFCPGWSDMRGCRIEHQIALDYGLTILYMPEQGAYDDTNNVECETAGVNLT